MIIKGTEEVFETVINGNRYEIHLCNTDEGSAWGTWLAQECKNGWYGSFKFGSNPDEAILRLVKLLEK